MADRAVLVMAYGTPADLADVERYYTDIRHGRPPPRELLEELVARYEAIGGRSPLLEITQAQAKGIERRLDGVTAFVGLKHAPPFIEEAIEAMAATGINDAVGLVLAPHYSAMSVGGYESRARAALRQVGWGGNFHMIASWHLERGFIRWVAQRVRAAVDSLERAPGDPVVVFTAHSLPARITATGDPYPEQLHATAAAVAAQAQLRDWRVGWQSAGRTSTPWLGPDLNEMLARLAEEGARAVVVCPCGFVADHLEVLYDIDIEAEATAQELGITLVRTASPNDDPEFLDVLAQVVDNAFQRP